MPTTSIPENANVPMRAQHIAIWPGFCGGKPHIAGHRIKVQHIAVWHERRGMSVEEIVATYPTLTLSQVYAALAYYHDHRSEIDEDIRDDAEFVARKRNRAGTTRLRQKLFGKSSIR